jgi:hypothetical protein
MTALTKLVKNKTPVDDKLEGLANGTVSLKDLAK